MNLHQKAKIVHIDVDTASISRNVVVDVPIVSDAKLALKNCWNGQKLKDTVAWQERIKAWDEKNPLEMRRDRGMTPDDHGNTSTIRLTRRFLSRM